MWEWMILPLKRYADFSGRSRRKEYWSWALLNLLVGLIPMYIIFSSVDWSALASNDRARINAMPAISGFDMTVLGLWGLWVLATIIPDLAVVVRRFHDLGYSGWWYLGLMVLGFLPFIGRLFGIIALGATLKAGVVGDNRYGPDPKAVDGSVFE